MAVLVFFLTSSVQTEGSSRVCVMRSSSVNLLCVFFFYELNRTFLQDIEFIGAATCSLPGSSQADVLSPALLVLS